MKSILSLFFVLVFASFMFNSCADDSTTPSTPKNYAPGDAGSYWIYHDTLTDSDTKITATDSTSAGPKETMKGKSATKYSVYLDGTFSESYYRHGADGKVYALPSEQIPAVIRNLLPDTLLPQDWVVIADENSASWTLFTFNLNDINFPTSFGDAKINGVVTVTGKKTLTQSFTVSGTNYTAQEFEIKTNFTGKVNMQGTNIDLNFDVKSKSYYADKVGLIKSDTPKQDININIPFVGDYKIFTVEQNTRMLHHFHLVSSVQ